jgi:hypothetical protein
MKGQPLPFYSSQKKHHIINIMLYAMLYMFDAEMYHCKQGVIVIAIKAAVCRDETALRLC